MFDRSKIFEECWKADMGNSLHTVFEEYHDFSYPSSPITHNVDRPNYESGSSNYKYPDANNSWSAHDHNAPPAADVVVDINDDAATWPSMEASNSSVIEASREESIGNRSSALNYDDDETSQSESEENEDSTPGHSKKKYRYNSQNVMLYEAALKGNWRTAKFIFDMDPSTINKTITGGYQTTLHVAALAKQTSFLEKLVQLCSSSDLTIQNASGNTALDYAAASEDVRIAKAMVDKNPDLPNIHDDLERTPVIKAIGYRRKDMASYLYNNTNFEALNTSQQYGLLSATIDSDYYDITLDILIKKPELAKARINENGDTALHMLARKSSAIIGSSSQLSVWKRHINSRFNEIYNTALMQTFAHQVVEHLWNFVIKNLSFSKLCKFIKRPPSLLHDAARVGNIEFLIIILRSYPDFIWTVDEDNKSIFHVAVENRQENVFSLIYQIGGVKDFLANFFNEKNNSNILHLAAMLASPYHLSRVSGAALQMQRELLWFKEVEKIVIPSHRESRCLQEVRRDNDDDDPLTPSELFTKEHKHLLKAGEEWMKNTANSCMLVATLITTVVFAAAFTVPGGNDDKDGIPIFQKSQTFTVFVVSDVAALVMSTTSILTFLSILTSRYAEEDFLISLPRKLLFGLVTLFVSITCMVVAFSSTFFIVYDKTKVKIPLIIAIVTILPIVCFCVFHFKLVVDILQSCFWPQFYLRKWKKRLF